MTHWAGCVLYYIALQEGLGAHTWLAIKPEFVASLGSFERRAMPRAGAGPGVAVFIYKDQLVGGRSIFTLEWTKYAR